MNILHAFAVSASGIYVETDLPAFVCSTWGDFYQIMVLLALLKSLFTFFFLSQKALTRKFPGPPKSLSKFNFRFS